MSDDEIETVIPCDKCCGEESWLKFCDEAECPNYVTKKIYEQLAIDYFDYKLETDTVFHIVNEAHKFEPSLCDRLLWQHEADFNIEEKVRTKISKINESLHSFSGTFMLEYILKLVQKGLISVAIQKKIEREIREIYKYEIFRDHFIEICDDAVEAHLAKKVNKEANMELVQRMKKRRIDSEEEIKKKKIDIGESVDQQQYQSVKNEKRKQKSTKNNKRKQKSSFSSSSMSLGIREGDEEQHQSDDLRLIRVKNENKKIRNFSKFLKLLF